MLLKTLREEVLEANLELVRRGLVLYTFGNASGIDRSQGLVAIKPSGVPYDELTPEQIVISDLTGKIGDHNLLRREFVIGNTAGLDGNQSLTAVDAAGIAEGVEHEAATNQFQVRFQHLFAQCLQQHLGKTRNPLRSKSSGQNRSRKRLRIGTLNGWTCLCQRLR